VKLVHLVGFIAKQFVTMHGHMNINKKYMNSHLKEKALDRTTWRNRFGGGFEPVVRQNTE
jgi:hypothetical protein